MPFPDCERIRYKKNPLVQVTCQLRFPSILKINESPVEFQEKIRDNYPIYNCKTELQQTITFDTQMTTKMQLIPKTKQTTTVKNHNFSSIDTKWHINLTPTFLALTTYKYADWEDFSEKLQQPFKALCEIYKPTYFERVGLRYIDAFDRSKLNLKKTKWSKLIQPFVLGFASNRHVEKDVKRTKNNAEIDLGNGATALIQTGLGAIGDLPLLSNSESVFIFDTDMYMIRKQEHEVNETLNYLHNNAIKIIHSAIKPKLHQAMEPEPHV